MFSFITSRNMNYAVCLTAGTLILITLVSLFIRCFSPDIWLDEALSLHISRYGWRELLVETAIHDVHPPLYYVILKSFVDLGSAATSPCYNIFFGKLASLFATLCCVILTGIKVYRQHGSATAALMCALGVCAPLSILNFGEEIRMYAWANFFVTAAYLWAWDAIESNKRKDWSLLCLFGILAAYTHHYALIAIGFIHLTLFLYILLKKRDLLIRWVGCILVSIAIYLPWFLITCSQTNRVQNHWWLATLTLSDILNCLHFCFHKSALIITFSVLSCYILLLELYRNKQFSFRAAYLLTGLFLPLALFAAGLTISWLMRPVLVSRYLLPALGCMWIALILGIYKSPKNSVFFLLCCIVLSIQVSFQLFSLNRSEYHAARKAYELLQLTEHIPNAALLFNRFTDAKTCLELTHADSYLLNTSRQSVTIPKYGSIDGILTDEHDIKALAGQQKTLIFAKSPSDDNLPSASFPEMNVTFVPILNQRKENAHRINRQNFELYRIIL